MPQTTNPTTSAEALNQIQTGAAAAQAPAQILAAQNAALGVDAAGNTVKGLRTSIDNTTKLLEKVAPSIMGRTANSLVTNAQATRQIGNEQAPISANLTKLGGQFNNATTDYNDLQARATQNANLAYQGQQDRQSYLQGLYDTLYGQEQDKLKAAEQTRQFNAELASEGSGDTGLDIGAILAALGGGSGGDKVTDTPTGRFTTTKSENGGINFLVDGKPVNAATYARNTGSTVRDLLSKSGDIGDAEIVKAIDSGMSWSDLASRWPYVFGGGQG